METVDGRGSFIYFCASPGRRVEAHYLGRRCENLHFAGVSKQERAWFGAVPITTVVRTLNDCACDGLSSELFRQATRQAVRRGLVARTDLADVKASLKPFGGL